MQRFQAFDLALETIRALRTIVPKIRRHDRHTAIQIRESASSVAANIAEGRRRIGKDRDHHYRIASGSADETQAHLLISEAWGDVEMAEIEPALELLDRELAILWKLTN